jgi:two-component system OmpR family response regulator
LRILVVEDDPQLLELIGSLLSPTHPIDLVSTFEMARDYIDSYSYGVVLLDRNLNDNDIGLELISHIKEKNGTTAILVMSAYGDVEDKIDGLNMGADDYIEKPFDTGELIARINALGRRFSNKSLLLGDISIDILHERVSKNGIAINLSKKEHALLFYLLSRVNQVVSRVDIVDNIYDHPEEIGSNTIEVMVTALRKKVSPTLIKTIKTRGYIIEHT